MAEYRWRSAGGGTWATLRGAFGLLSGAMGLWMDETRRTMMGMGRGWALDLRFVGRSLWRARGYVLTTVLVLACAVAATASVFSYVRGTLLYEPPYPDAESVMIVWGSSVERGQRRDVISGPNYIDLKDRLTALDPVAALHTDAAYLMVDGRPEVMTAQEVTADFFRVLGVEPALGRLFDDKDRMSGAAETVVVSHGFWRDRLGGSPDALGSVLQFEGDPRTVIGVLPEGFEFIAPAPLYVPLRDDVLAAEPRGNIHYNVLGRLVPGATLADVDRELEPVVAAIETEYPRFEGWSFLVEPLHEVSVEAVRPVIVILAITAILVLLVALVNLATLFRIRAFARGAELRVRSALGAGKVRVARVFALETVGLALVGAVLGLLATPFLLGRIGELVPVWIAIPDSAARVPVLQALLDPGVAAVALIGAPLGSLLLTLPTFRAALRASTSNDARGRVHPGLRGTRLLVAVELAVATILCIGAGLTARSTSRLLSTDVGIEAEGLLTLYFGDVWGDDAEERTAYFRQVVEEVERVPGVRRAGVIGYVDFQAEDDFAAIYFHDRQQDAIRETREEWRRVDAGLFESAGMRIVDGRDFDSRDFVATPRSVVVNESFARKHYPDGRAVGARISTHNDRYQDLTIVGVVADIRSLGPAAPPPPMVYAPFQGDPRGTQGLYVRVDGTPMTYAEAVREAIWSVDPSQPVTEVQPMSELVDMWVAIPRATRGLVGALAALAWLLSVVGLFGVVAYAVRTRRTELGIRLALGASPRRLETDQVKAVVPVVAIGIVTGLALGLAGARAASAVLYGVSPLDPLPVAGALLAMGTATFLATYLPARRVGGIDPREVIADD